MKIQDCWGVMSCQLADPDILEGLALFMFRILVIFFNSLGHEDGESSLLRNVGIYRLTLYHNLDERNIREIYN
jgi:hypothetical protein